MLETIFSISFLAILPSFLGFIIQLIRKKPNKKILGLATICFLIIFIITAIPVTKKSSIESNQKSTKIEKETETFANKQEKTNQKKNKQKKTKTVEKKETNPAAKKQEKKVTSIEYSEIYKSFKSNELLAKEKYNGNLYKTRAKINGMETGGLLNLTGGATLTMEKKVGNTIVFFYAEFEKDQEEKLKRIKVGDEIEFIGECQGGNFIDCKLQ